MITLQTYAHRERGGEEEKERGRGER